MKSISIGQLVTVRAKIAHLHSAKEIKSKKLKMQEALIVEPSSILKLVLWAEFVDSVSEGNMYTFANIRLQKDTVTYM